MPLTGPFPGHTELTTFADLRRDLEGLIVRDSAGQVRAGIFPAHLGPLVTGRSDMKVNIADFRGVQSRGGAVLLANVGTDTSVQLPAAPPANKRIDLVYVTMRSTTLGDAASTPVFGFVQGTASPTPTVPSLPPNLVDALPLATVEIPAGATTTLSAGVIISQVYPYTAMAGGTVVVRNSVELAAWTPADGAKAYSLADGGEFVRTGSAWTQGGGLIVYGSNDVTRTSAGIDFIIATPTLAAGTKVRVETSALSAYLAATGGALYSLVYTTNGVDPTSGSTLMVQGRFYGPAPGATVSAPALGEIFTMPTTGVLKVGLYVGMGLFAEKRWMAVSRA